MDEVVIPEAPIWYDNSEASAWSSGYEAGFMAAVARMQQDANKNK